MSRLHHFPETEYPRPQPDRSSDSRGDQRDLQSSHVFLNCTYDQNRRFVPHLEGRVPLLAVFARVGFGTHLLFPPAPGIITHGKIAVQSRNSPNQESKNDEAFH
jgi:hypothetical protein